MYRRHREQARSHTGSSVGKKLVFGTDPSVGAKLARDSGGSACLDVGYAGVIASKLAPTLDLQWTRNLCSAQIPLGEQSLLAIAVGQLAWILDMPASSRASPLPHWIVSGQETCVWHSSLCGSELARDSGGSVCLDVGCAGVIASKPAPTLDLQWARNLCSAQFPLWEQSLLAMAGGNVLALSRASLAPTWR